MTNPLTEIDRVKDVMDELSTHVSESESAFRLIAKLARDIDQDNYMNVSEQIFSIAFDHY